MTRMSHISGYVQFLSQKICKFLVKFLLRRICLVISLFLTFCVVPARIAFLASTMFFFANNKHQLKIFWHIFLQTSEPYFLIVDKNSQKYSCPVTQYFFSFLDNILIGYTWHGFAQAIGLKHIYHRKSRQSSSGILLHVLERESKLIH